jgi:hypothetical protein
VLRFAAAGVAVIAAFCGSDVFRDSSRAPDASHVASLNEDLRGQPLIWSLALTRKLFFFIAIDISSFT